MNRIRILLVDDSELLRRALRALLGRQSDMEIVGDTGDGADAVRLLETVSADVVLLDMTMPGLSGADTALRIKETVPGAKILVFSGNERLDHVRQMLSAGADGYARKTAPPDELARAIRRVHAGERYIDAALEKKLRERPEEGA